MKPLLHAKISAKRFGGVPQDYIEIHNWFDSTKAHIPNATHRLVLHNAFGIYLAEQLFGEWVEHKGKMMRMPYITNSSGRQVSVRDVGEQHVIDDLGTIPTLAECMAGTPMKEQFAGNLTRAIAKSGTFTIVD